MRFEVALKVCQQMAVMVRQVVVVTDIIGVLDRQRQYLQQLVKPYQPDGMPMDELVS